MAESRYNNQGGSLGADPGISGTTITFAVVPDFATLTGGDTITLVLDAGLPTFEIVHVTAYTAGATTGTMTRAAEDGTNWPAVAHPIAVGPPATGTWLCGPTVNDFISGGGAVSSVFTRTGAVTATSGDYSVGQVTGAAPLASPTFTGTPTMPTGATGVTQSPGDSSTALATTEYTDTAVAVETTRAEAAEAGLVPSGADINTSGLLQSTANVRTVIGYESVSDLAPMTANLPFGGFKGVGAAAGTAPGDLATVSQVPNTFTDAAVCVSVTNVALSGLLTVDGHTLVATEVVLLVAQTTASQNGLWVAASGAWARPNNFATGSACASRVVAVTKGTALANSIYILDTPITSVDTTSQTWVNVMTGVGGENAIQSVPRNLFAVPTAALDDNGQQIKNAGAGTVGTDRPIMSQLGGWIPSADTWVYGSASTFTIAGVDRTAQLTKGTKISWTEVATITNVALTSNVVTITAPNAYSNSQSVVIAGLTNTILNGTWIVTGSTGSTFTFALTHANITSVADSGTSTAVKYGVVATSTFSTNTTVTIMVNVEYVISNTTLSAPLYSYGNPPGFPSRFTYAASGATGFSALPSVSVSWWSVNSGIVTLQIWFLAGGTSNTGTFTVPLPVNCILGTTTIAGTQDAGTWGTGTATASGSTLTFNKVIGAANGFASSGTKNATVLIQYPL